MNLENGFNKQNLGEIRTYLEANFEKVFQETGVRIKMGNFRFDDEMFTTSLECRCNVANQEDANKKEWDKYCRNFGLMPGWFGQEFTHSGQTYVICGIKKYADTKPVVAHLKGDPSKKFVWPSTTVIPKFLTKTDKYEI